MILLAASVSCFALSALRFGLGPSAPAVPWLGLAWTLLFARHSRRGTFAAYAVVLGLIDGFCAPATWTVWPLAYLVAGGLAFASRRLLAVRGSAGECIMGALGAALVLAAARLFPPAGLPPSPAPVVPASIGIALTGVASGVLTWLSHRWVRLRMRITAVV